MTEQQVIAHLTKLTNGDIRDKTYRKSLIRLFVNKIFLYDDRITITFNTGDEETTITDVLLSKIENGLSGKNPLCIKQCGSPSRSKVRFAPTYFFVCDRKEGIRLSPWLLLFTKNSRSAHLSGSKRPARRLAATFRALESVGASVAERNFFSCGLSQNRQVSQDAFRFYFLKSPSLGIPVPH